MKKKLNILVVSYSPWNNQTNDGNTLNNLFRNVDANFSNIFFSEGLPCNDKCVNYFQYTDKMIINRLIKFKKIGNRFSIDSVDNVAVSQFEAIGKQHKSDLLVMLREIAWSCVNLITDDLKQFINDIKPDIVFFPTYGTLRLLKFDLHLKKICKAPFVGFISDDLHSYKSGQSILENINQYFIRKKLHKVFASYDLVYTMTEEQRNQIKTVYNKDSKILRKSVYRLGEIHSPSKPMHFIYAGGLYFGRYQTLNVLSSALQHLSSKMGYKVGEVHVYSFDRPNELIINDYLKIHDGVNYEELLTIYDNSDVALVVESFEQKFIDITKLSFSTKILDCLQSGCAILAISPQENAGVTYLNQENAAIVVNKLDEVEIGVTNLVNNYSVYQDNARSCVLKNHDSLKNSQLLLTDFYNLVGSENE